MMTYVPRGFMLGMYSIVQKEPNRAPKLPMETTETIKTARRLPKNIIFLIFFLDQLNTRLIRCSKNLKCLIVQCLEVKQ